MSIDPGIMTVAHSVDGGIETGKSTEAGGVLCCEAAAFPGPQHSRGAPVSTLCLPDAYSSKEIGSACACVTLAL